MSVETELFTLLSTDPGVTALVGTHIYPLVADEQAALPLVVYRRTGDDRVRAMPSDALVRSMFRFDCWDTTFAGAKALAAAVGAALDRYSGGNIDLILLQDEIPLRDDTTNDYRISVGAEVAHYA